MFFHRTEQPRTELYRKVAVSFVILAIAVVGVVFYISFSWATIILTSKEELRKESAKIISSLDFDGIAIGGVAVGESKKEMRDVLKWIHPFLPEEKPRHLLGIGEIDDIFDAVSYGMDTFDCVIPTREARHGRLYGFLGETDSILNAGADFYNKVNIKNEEYKFDMSPINATSRFVALRTYSKAYLRHLFVVEDPLAPRLATLNNLEFYLELMNKIRREIESK